MSVLIIDNNVKSATLLLLLWLKSHRLESLSKLSSVNSAIFLISKGRRTFIASQIDDSTFYPRGRLMIFFHFDACSWCIFKRHNSYITTRCWRLDFHICVNTHLMSRRSYYNGICASAILYLWLITTASLLLYLIEGCTNEGGDLIFAQITLSVIETMIIVVVR